MIGGNEVEQGERTEERRDRKHRKQAVNLDYRHKSMVACTCMHPSKITIEHGNPHWTACKDCGKLIIALIGMHTCMGGPCMAVRMHLSQ